MIDCNERKAEKRHECANMGKVKRLELWWQPYSTSLPVRDLENFRPTDFCSTECTSEAKLKTVACSLPYNPIHIIHLQRKENLYYITTPTLNVDNTCSIRLTFSGILKELQYYLSGCHVLYWFCTPFMM